MSARYRTAMFLDQGERTFPRHHLVYGGAFLGAITAHSRFGARTVGIVESQLAACVSPFTRPDEVRDTLLAISAKIAERNREPTDDAGTASVVLTWEKLDERIEVAQCGGGHVFHVSGGVVTPVTTARSVERLTKETGSALPDPKLGHLLTTMLGVAEPVVDLAYAPWAVGDRIVIISDVDASTDELIAILKEAGEDVPRLAGEIASRIRPEARTRGVAVVVRELSGVD